jgi:hypothetical protein
MGYVAALRWIIPVLALAVLSPQNASANDCDAHRGCRKSPLQQTTATYLPPPFVAFGSITGPIVGCYGFDHGPMYSPTPCNFPNPYGYRGTYKGTSKRGKHD